MIQVPSVPKDLPSLRISAALGHFKTMMGPYGFYQHATERVPLLTEGYCVDDNARAVMALLHLLPLITEAERATVQEYIVRCWQFVIEAEETPGHYYNFRSAEGEWLPHGRSDDMYARILRAYVHVLTHDTDATRQEQAAAKMPALLTTLATLSAPRAWAEIVLALSELPPSQRPGEADELISKGLTRLVALWQAEATPQWPWFESSMTYANALFPHSMLLSTQGVHATAEHHEIVERSTQFLLQSTIRDGVFIPIGSVGWYPKGGTPSIDNQQAIEAGTMCDFLIDYMRLQPEKKLPVEVLAAPYLWFYGQNTNKQLMVNPADGSCLDGLFIKGPNVNCGAESLWAYLWSEIRLRQAPVEIRQYIATRRQELLAE